MGGVIGNIEKVFIFATQKQLYRVLKIIKHRIKEST